MVGRWQRFVRRFAETYFGRKMEPPIKVMPRINWTVTCPCKKGPLKGKITVGNKLEADCLNCGRLFKLTVEDRVGSIPAIGFCAKCGFVAQAVPGGCDTCAARKNHEKECLYRKAVECPVAIQCEHGLDICLKCTPCTCKKGKTIS